MSSKVLSYLDIDQKKSLPMNQEQCKLFMDCYFIERHELQQTSTLRCFDESAASELGPLGMIFWKRISWQPEGIDLPRISVPLGVFAVFLGGATPGGVVMWAYTLNRLFQKKRKMLTIDDLANVFPLGFPSPEQELEIWDAQKCHCHGVQGGVGGNMVDIASTWLLD